MCALIAIGSGADSAIDSDLGNPRVTLSKLLCVAYGVDMLDTAAHGDRQAFVLRVSCIAWAVNCPSKNKKTLPVGSFDKLRHDAARRSERRVDIQARACAAILRQMKTGRIEAFCDVARLVDPQKKEWYALGRFALKGGCAVASLFETHAKSQ